MKKVRSFPNLLARQTILVIDDINTGSIQLPVLLTLDIDIYYNDKKGSEYSVQC